MAQLDRLTDQPATRVGRQTEGGRDLGHAELRHQRNARTTELAEHVRTRQEVRVGTQEPERSVLVGHHTVLGVRVRPVGDRDEDLDLRRPLTRQRRPRTVEQHGRRGGARDGVSEGGNGLAHALILFDHAFER